MGRRVGGWVGGAHCNQRQQLSAQVQQSCACADVGHWPSLVAATLHACNQLLQPVCLQPWCLTAAPPCSLRAARAVQPQAAQAAALGALALHRASAGSLWPLGRGHV